MPSARLAPGPRGMMPADGLDKSRVVQRLRRIPSSRCQANRRRTGGIRYLLHWTFVADSLGSKPGGARRDRTDDLLLAKQALSQLSYGPVSTLESTSRHTPSREARPPENGGPGK